MANDFIAISTDDADELREVLEGLMYAWHPRDNASDNCCELCHVTAEFNGGHINHDATCRGEALLLVLTVTKATVI